jgi:phosphoglycolate phosphatase-like HAD superfamily hydrolase
MQDEQSYLALDLDNTVWEKQKLDDLSYKLASQKLLDREISMLTHPVTGEPDTDFANHSNHEIWKYKIQQVLYANIPLNKKDQWGTTTLVESVGDVDIDRLVEQLGTEAYNHLLKTPRLDGVVNTYLSRNSLQQLRRCTSAIGVASSGARMLQHYLLQRLGLLNNDERIDTSQYSLRPRKKVALNDKDEGIDPVLCVYADEGKDKAELIATSYERCIATQGRLPGCVVYVGDSTGDMTAVQRLKKTEPPVIPFKAVGVETGMASETELLCAGADIVVPNLSDAQNIKTLEEFLRSLK